MPPAHLRRPPPASGASPRNSAEHLPELGAGGDAELAVAAGEVDLDGLGGHEQRLRDVPVAAAPPPPAGPPAARWLRAPRAGAPRGSAAGRRRRRARRSPAGPGRSRRPGRRGRARRAAARGRRPGGWPGAARRPTRRGPRVLDAGRASAPARRPPRPAHRGRRPRRPRCAGRGRAAIGAPYRRATASAWRPAPAPRPAGRAGGRPAAASVRQGSSPGCTQPRLARRRPRGLEDVESLGRAVLGQPQPADAGEQTGVLEPEVEPVDLRAARPRRARPRSTRTARGAEQQPGGARRRPPRPQLQGQPDVGLGVQQPTRRVGPSPPATPSAAPSSTAPRGCARRVTAASAAARPRDRSPAATSTGAARCSTPVTNAALSSRRSRCSARRARPPPRSCGRVPAPARPPRSPERRSRRRCPAPRWAAAAPAGAARPSRVAGPGPGQADVARPRADSAAPGRCRAAGVDLGHRPLEHDQRPRQLPARSADRGPAAARSGPGGRAPRSAASASAIRSSRRRRPEMRLGRPSSKSTSARSRRGGGSASARVR